MDLWIDWWSWVVLLRPASSRDKTFLWLATAIAGFVTRLDPLSVTSVVRSLMQRPSYRGRSVRALAL
jgi:hypothetical protein